MFVSGYPVSVDTASAFWVVLSYLYLFFIGGFIGWIIEVFFRRFVSMKKWINPGFLKGPCLPLYGFGICALHTISTFCLKYMLAPDDPMVTDAFYKLFAYASDGTILEVVPSGCLPFWAVSIICVLLIGIAMTVIEFIAGLIFIKGFHVRLWDYSKLKGNVWGLVCPLFSSLWLAFGAVYWFGLRPLVDKLLAAMIPHVWVVTFALGACVAVFIIDCVASVKLTLGVRKEAKRLKQIVDFELFKLNMRDVKFKSAKLDAFKESVRNSFSPLTDKISQLVYKVKASIYIDNKIPEKTNESETPRTKTANEQ